MRPFASRFYFFGILSLIVVVSSSAGYASEDAAGCRDPLGLKRFKDSVLVQCEARDFATYMLPKGKLLSWDYTAQKAKFESHLDLSGRLTSNLYLVPIGVSSEEVMANYRLELEQMDFGELFAANGLAFGIDQGRFFESFGPGGQLVGYSPDRSHFIAAAKETGEQKTYVSLYILEFQGGMPPKIQPQLNQVLVRLDTIETGNCKSVWRRLSPPANSRRILIHLGV